MDFRTVVFIDANVALECLALSQLPWKEIDTVGPILILVTPTVLREVDSKKTHSRLGDHARRFNATLRPLLTGSASVAVRERPDPVVHVGLANCRSIDWSAYPDLDPSEADARIVAEAIHTDLPRGCRSLVVSQDIRPLDLARKQGLLIHHISDAWLRPKEITEAERKAAALARELKAMKSKEPTLTIEWGPVQSPTDVYRVKRLTDAERQQFIDRVLAANPMARQDMSHQTYLRNFGLDQYDHSLSSRYEKYEKELVPEFARKLEAKLELMFNQLELTVTFRNIGKVQAESLRLDVSATGGWLNDRLIYVGPAGPSNPRPKTNRLLDHLRPPQLFNTPRQRARHEVVLEIEPDRSDYVQITCEDFRHGSQYEYKMVGWLDPHIDEPLIVEAVATAANLHGDVAVSVEVAKNIVEVEVTDLLDLGTFKYKDPPAAHLKLLQVLQSTNSDDYSSIEFDDPAAD
jgi:hypothetical protein